jgi:hypothetical protein
MTQPELNQLNSFRKIGRALLHYEMNYTRSKLRGI